MIQQITYSVFQSYPEISCNTLWIPDEEFVQYNSPQLPKSSFLPILEFAGIQLDSLVFAQQVHGNVVKFVERAGTAEKCDGLITANANLNLAIKTADCAAVMISDPHKKLIANLHAGWRGVRSNIIQSALDIFNIKHESDLKNLIVAVSPFIKKCCYEVGPEFTDYFSDEYLERKDQNLFLNLEAAILDQLLKNNIPPIQIELSEHCTKCSSLILPSYRRNNIRNRLLSIISKQEF